MNDTNTYDEGEVFIVVSIEQGEVTHLEVLDSRPKWDLVSLGQKCFDANINGGDSIELHLCQYDGCDQLSTEFYEINDDDGVNFCIQHYEEAIAEAVARRNEGPTLTSQVKTPIHDWMELREWPPGMEG